MARPIRIACWMSLFGLLTIHSVLAESPRDGTIRTTIRTSGTWTIVESDSFRCWSQLPEQDARELAESCEVWRQRLRTTWISGATETTWTPKCEVYVHTTRGAYNQILNRPGDMSVGSTIIQFDQGRTVVRRIDVRADASDWSNSALPHELTHVVLGERFGGHALPRWADEGIAMLSESSDKHRERLENLQQILAGQPTLSMGDLVQTTRMPVANLRDAFYGQSLALSSMLIRKSTPAQFADFVEASVEMGIERALKQHYNLDGVAALQKEWDACVRRPATVSFVSLPIQVGKATKVATATP